MQVHDLWTLLALESCMSAYALQGQVEVWQGAPTLQLGVCVARGVEGRPEQEADGAQEHKVEAVPEVAGDPVVAPLLVVLVGHLPPAREPLGMRAVGARAGPSVLGMHASLV